MIYEIEIPENCWVRASSPEEAVKLADAEFEWDETMFSDYLPPAEDDQRTEDERFEQDYLPTVKPREMKPEEIVRIGFECAEDAPKFYLQFPSGAIDFFGSGKLVPEFDVPVSALDEYHEDGVFCAERWGCY